MITFTVSQISSIINAGILIIQVTLPLALGFVLAGILNNSNTAVTWSVVDGMLQRSYWPSVLGSDSAASTGVRSSVSILSWVSLIGVILLSAASVLTPLGISEEIRSSDFSNPLFDWAQDNKSFSMGTASRFQYSLTRVCGYADQLCPGQIKNTTIVDTGDFYTAPYNTNNTHYLEETSSSSSSTLEKTTYESSSSSSTTKETSTQSTSEQASTDSTLTKSLPTSTSTGETSTKSTPTATPSSSSTRPTDASDTSKSTPTDNTPTKSSTTSDVIATPTNTPINTPTPTSPGTSVPTKTTPAVTPTDSPTVTPAAPRDTSVINIPGVPTPISNAQVSSSALIKRSTGPNHKRGISSTTRRIGSGVPQKLKDIFTSAGSVYGAGVANLFEIQFRNYIILNSTTQAGKILDNGKLYTIGQFRFLETLVLNNRYELVDGLVVDTKDGGIGFRDHTMPVNKRYGASWSETLLWMEPSTVCVDNNITIEVTTSDESDATSVLIDRGGFSDVLGAQVPPALGQGSSATKLDLYERAYNGAFYLNQRYAESLGLSREDIETEGRTYNITMENLPALRSIADDLSTSQWGVHRIPLTSLFNTDGEQNVTLIDTHCGGFVGEDSADITKTSVQCGLIVGAGQRTDSSNSTQSAGSWRYPLYTCATAVRASLKQVGLVANGTSLSLENLRVVNIEDISYPGRIPEPVWAVEKTGMQIRQVRALWGLIDGKYAGDEGLSTVRGSHLYLPAGQNFDLRIDDSLAGAGFYQNAQFQTYASSTLMPDYTGKTNYAMFRKWEELSKSPQSASLIPRLIWTDIMSNAVMGTRSVVSGQGSPAIGNMGVFDYKVYKKVIVYKYIYAIPIFVLVALWIFLLASAILFWISSRVTLSTLRQLLNQTATGRVVTNILSPGSEDSGMPTEQWIQNSGTQKIGLSNPGGLQKPSIGGEAEDSSLMKLRTFHFTGDPEDKRMGDVLRETSWY